MTIPKEILGAAISGAIGAGLFFLQKLIDKKGNEKILLFQIYQLINTPPSFQGTDFETYGLAIREDSRLRAEITGLAVMLKNRDLARDILSYSLIMPQDRTIKKIELLKKIANKLNKKTRKIMDKIIEDKSS